MRIEIPQINTWAKERGVTNILKALLPITEEQRVIFSFTNCRFISAEAVTVLSGTKLARDQYGRQTQIDMSSLDNNVKRFLGKSQFLHLFGQKVYPWKDTSLPIYTQTELSKEGILRYIDHEIMKRHEMPEMSEALYKEIRRAFFEIFGNIFYHSESPFGGLVCGQVYPNEKKIQIVFYDGGIGLAKHVREVFPPIQSDIEAIEWALRRGTSTLSNHHESRGLGLYLLRQFLRVNEGEFRIYANRGIVEEVAGNRRSVNLRYSLNGTLIDMRIRVRNDVKYIFSSEDEK